MKLHIYKTKEKLAGELASWIGDLIQATLKNQEYFTLALSGGETPQPLYKKLATAEFREKINWKRVHIFWGDERVVPSTDERNNAKMAYDLLLDHIDIPAEQVHRMRTDIEPVFAATEYEKTLQKYFGNTFKSFDLVLLGIGDDGHTLSIFPESPLIESADQRFVSSVYNEQQKMYRITLTPAIVNRASEVAFMVDGPGKAKVLKEIIEGEYMPLTLPAQLIKPANGELHWFLDKEASHILSATNNFSII